jgi:hypothetical protein
LKAGVALELRGKQTESARAAGGRIDVVRRLHHNGARGSTAIALDCNLRIVTFLRCFWRLLAVASLCVWRDTCLHEVKSKPFSPVFPAFDPTSRLVTVRMQRGGNEPT